MKTADLTGALLDYWVARADGVQAIIHRNVCYTGMSAKHVVMLDSGYAPGYAPSAQWAHGGPIIERYKISIATNEVFVPGRKWVASLLDDCSDSVLAEAPLIAAMRCLVQSKFGDDVPDEVRA